MKNKEIIISVFFCVLCVSVMIYALILSENRVEKSGEFVPPPFDDAAQSGTPEVPQELGWSLLAQEGLGYTAHVCGRPVISGEELTVYFTSPDTNIVWLKLRVIDTNGEVLGESGIIRPGEYVRSVSLDTTLSDGAQIKLKIMAYEPQTYFSEGAVTLNTTVQAG